MTHKEAMYSTANSGSRRKLHLLFCAAVVIACLSLTGSALAGGKIPHNTPGYVATAKVLGAEDPSKVIDVSIWLNLHNRSGLDALAQQVYDRTSPNYRHWLKRADFAARFAPTAAEAKTVQQFFESHNMKVVTTGPNNFFVRARGSVADVEAAFRVQLNNYQVNGKTVRANTTDPYVDGAAAPLVRTISGLDTGEYEHPLMLRPTSLPNSKTASTGAAFSAAASFFTTDCFDGVKTEKYTTGGTFPKATFAGNHYFETPTSAGCGYTPPEIYTAYHLNGLYKEGHDGTGQTVVIIDWCGSLTITQDANAFSKKFGLPALTSSNFSIIEFPTKSTCAGPSLEINLDVEWAHAIAPGANIDLLVPPSASFQDVNEAEYFAVNNGLGNVVSGSYGSVESFTPQSELDNENLISEIAAVTGISTNFSTGDDGDFTVFGIPPTVSAPADSPWATAVGGVTLALKPDNSINFQTGWGNNETLLTDTGTIFDPPLTFGLYGGAGGGPSNCASQDSNGNCLAGFPKPSFQKGLPGKFRQLPDISWLADPFTGGVVLITEAGQFPPQVWFAVGGTSLSCPMFSALWAIANEEAGAPLGQAAQYVYSLPSGAVTDIVPVGSPNNVTASIQESKTVTNVYTPAEVAGVTGGKFLSALWDYPFSADTTLALTFGTDSGLTTKTGWDNVTGVGTPNGKAFADSFKAP